MLLNGDTGVVKVYEHFKIIHPLLMKFHYCCHLCVCVCVCMFRCVRVCPCACVCGHTGKKSVVQSILLRKKASLKANSKKVHRMN